VAAILGNILVCVAIATDRNLRKLSHLFFVSMALAGRVDQDGDSQNFLRKFLRFFVTLGLKILRL